MRNLAIVVLRIVAVVSGFWAISGSFYSLPFVLAQAEAVDGGGVTGAQVFAALLVLLLNLVIAASLWCFAPLLASAATKVGGQGISINLDEHSLLRISLQVVGVAIVVLSLAEISEQLPSIWDGIRAAARDHDAAFELDRSNGYIVHGLIVPVVRTALALLLIGWACRK